MDGFSLFNVSFGELFLILLLAALIMGPGRIRSVARWLGTTTAKFQRLTRQFTAQINAELDAGDRVDLKAAMDDIQELRRQVRDLRSEVLALPTAAARPAAAQPTRKPANGTPTPLNGADEEHNAIAPPAAKPQLPNVIDVEDDPE